ncbi:hypothetical protein FBU30_000444 [Linnemannia zychae]|nr:hypothetical protein FBU30_000444 [Linnemannia zychae]
MLASSTPSNADLILEKDNVHHLNYFPFHGLAGCIRTTLVLIDEPFENHCLSFAEWMKYKPTTPFGHVPILREETKCGKFLEIAEISNIEFYLAKRGKLIGQDFWEETQIKMFHSSTHNLFTFLVQNVVQLPKSDKAAFLTRFKKNNLPQWIRAHEKYLAANGSNGHYIGDQLSIADIKTASVIDHLVNLGGENEDDKNPLLSSELTPAIWAVKTNLEKNPKYAEWRDSKQYQEFTKSNLGFLGF